MDGYHGTSIRSASTILQEGFVLSQNSYDWLGHGVYFFQDGCVRARDWAKREFANEWAVLRAKLDLDGCMDLLDPSWFSVLRVAYDGVIKHHQLTGLRLPRQVGLARGMDRAVINYAVGILAEEGIEVRSVRGVFEEGAPAFPGSALHDLAHIQIAVRDLSAIGSIEVIQKEVAG